MAAASRALKIFHSSSRPANTGSLMISSIVISGSKRVSRLASELQKLTNAVLPGRVEFRGAFFVVDIHHDEQPGAVKAFDGGFELFAALFDDVAGGPFHDDLRRDAEADVLKSDARHERGFIV